MLELQQKGLRIVESQIKTNVHRRMAAQQLKEQRESTFSNPTSASKARSRIKADTKIDRFGNKITTWPNT